MRLAVVVSRYNENITRGLLEGALRTFRKHGISSGLKDTVWVPGAFEIPLAAQTLARTRKYAAVIALGCVLKGETSHHHYISKSVAQALMDIGLETNVPVAFGVLTPNSMKQAKARSGKGSGNKGEEAAEAAIEMARSLQRLKG